MKRSYEIRKIEIAPEDFDYEVYVFLKPTLGERLFGQSKQEWFIGRFKEREEAETAMKKDLSYPITRLVYEYDENGNRDIYFPL